MESDARAAVVGTEAITEHRGIRARYNARVAYLDPHASCSVSGLAHPMDPIHLLRRGSPFAVDTRLCAILTVVVIINHHKPSLRRYKYQ